MKNSLNLKQLNLCSLEETKEWYLECLKPFVNKLEYLEARNNIETFILNEGSLLQDKLEKYKKDIYPNSWLMPYSKDIYLNGRGPVAIKSNYLLETIPYKKDIDYLTFVVRLICGIQDLYIDLSNKKINQMKTKDQLLCMKQLKGFLRGTRILNHNKDIYEIFEDYKDINSGIIFYKNNCYQIKLFEEDGTKISEQEIFCQIKQILDTVIENDKLSISVLAFNNHDDSLKIIEQHQDNQKNLEILNKGMFCLTLWDKNSTEVSTNQKTYYDTSNAWPLKSWNIDAFRDLVCTFNNEHTYVDGATSSTLVCELFDRIDKIETVFNNNDYSKVSLNELTFDFNQESLKLIKDNYLKYANQFDSKRFEFNNLNTNKIRSNKINIDAVYQLGFLYADYYTFKELKVIHESVSVAHFYDGRTSCLKSASCEGIEFVKALASSSDVKVIFDLLKNASLRHLEGISKAKDFCCIARHLAGLNLMSENEISIYQDKYLQKYLDQEICTSSMGNNKLINRFSYAPVSENGLGIGYLCHDDKFIADISYYKSDEADIVTFYNKLNEYFIKINDFLDKI
ncbi:carnitine O-acetyltransferase [Bacilli bacterium PM5-9]|nr:carnitine O-acetyltransferase [Bacilli bacterium PM5-9]